MPKVRTEEITVRNKAAERGFSHAKVDIYVNARGKFYASVPDYLELIVKNTFSGQWQPVDNKAMVKVFDKDIDNLVRKLNSVFSDHFTPEIKEEYFIAYNIESHIAFVTNNQGKVYPNGAVVRDEYEEGTAGWANSDMYGSHYATTPCKGGYSLKIGARAVKKITYTYSKSEKIEYEDYKGSESAKKLNQWASFRLDYSQCKKIKLTDDSANFFYDLMMGMARLSQLVQTRTFDENILQQMIESNTKLLN